MRDAAKDSWWKRLIRRVRTATTSEGVRKRLRNAERAAEATYLDKPLAEANNLQAEGAAAVIAALSGTANASVQVGSLLVVKTTDCNGKTVIIARTLSVEELRYLQQKQSIAREPALALELLQLEQHHPSNRPEPASPITTREK